MDLTIQAKSIDLNSRAEEYIQKKLERLERRLRPAPDARLEISRTSARSQADRVVVQLTLSGKGYTLRGQERGRDLFAAIDAVTDVMDRQIRRYKGKTYRSEQGRRARKAGAVTAAQQAAADEAQDGVEDDELQPPTVVRTKRFLIKPMFVEDAVMEMELLSHSFFLFYNIESDEYNVAYRRSDGGYGVIEPELS